MNIEGVNALSVIGGLFIGVFGTYVAVVSSYNNRFISFEIELIKRLNAIYADKPKVSALEISIAKMATDIDYIKDHIKRLLP